MKQPIPQDLNSLTPELRSVLASYSGGSAEPKVKDTGPGLKKKVRTMLDRVLMNQDARAYALVEEKDEAIKSGPNLPSSDLSQTAIQAGELLLSRLPLNYVGPLTSLVVAGRTPQISSVSIGKWLAQVQEAQKTSGATISRPFNVATSGSTTLALAQPLTIFDQAVNVDVLVAALMEIQVSDDTADLTVAYRLRLNNSVAFPGALPTNEPFADVRVQSNRLQKGKARSIYVCHLISASQTVLNGPGQVQQAARVPILPFIISQNSTLCVDEMLVEVSSMPGVLGASLHMVTSSSPGLSNLVGMILDGKLADQASMSAFVEKLYDV